MAAIMYLQAKTKACWSGDQLPFFFWILAKNHQTNHIPITHLWNPFSYLRCQLSKKIAYCYKVLVEDGLPGEVSATCASEDSVEFFVADWQVWKLKIRNWEILCQKCWVWFFGICWAILFWHICWRYAREILVLMMCSYMFIHMPWLIGKWYCIEVWYNGKCIPWDVCPSIRLQLTPTAYFLLHFCTQTVRTDIKSRVHTERPYKYTVVI